MSYKALAELSASYLATRIFRLQLVEKLANGETIENLDHYNYVEALISELNRRTVAES